MIPDSGLISSYGFPGTLTDSPEKAIIIQCRTTEKTNQVADLIELFGETPLPDILVIIGIILIFIVNIHSSRFTVTHPKCIVLLGILLLTTGIIIHTVPLLSSNTITKPPQFVQTIILKISQLVKKHTTETITIRNNEIKKLFDGNLTITATKISAETVNFIITDCSENRGITFCSDKALSVNKKKRIIYVTQDYNYLIEIKKINLDSGYIICQIKKTKQLPTVEK